MIKTPEFLKEARESVVIMEDMQTIQELIEAYDQKKEEVARAEKQLAMVKKSFNTLILDRIPEFLLSHGFNKLSLRDGREVKIKEDISVTIKDDIAFRAWLKERGEDSIIKTKYAFPALEPGTVEKLADYFIDNDIEYQVDESIHSQTKNKYFRELLKEMNREELPDWVSIYDIRKAVIK